MAAANFGVGEAALGTDGESRGPRRDEIERRDRQAARMCDQSTRARFVLFSIHPLMPRLRFSDPHQPIPPTLLRRLDHAPLQPLERRVGRLGDAALCLQRHQLRRRPIP